MDQKLWSSLSLWPTLRLEYFRMAFSDRPLRKAAFWNALTDQYTNITFVWQVGAGGVCEILVVVWMALRIRMAWRLEVWSMLASLAWRGVEDGGGCWCFRTIQRNPALEVFINRVLIDSVLTSPPVEAFYTGIFPQSRSGKAILLVALMILPHLMITFLYRLKAQRRIMGMAVNQLCFGYSWLGTVMPLFAFSFETRSYWLFPKIGLSIRVMVC